MAFRRIARRRPETPYQRFAEAYPAFIERLATLRRYRDGELANLAAAQGRERRDLVRKLLHSRELFVLYAFEGMKGAKRLADATPDTVNDLAHSCTLFAETRGEPIVAREVDKGSGKRIVQDFGPRRRMQQALVADILRHLHPPLPQQFLFRGGMPMAFGVIEDAYREGHRFGVEVDFIDFYGSVRLEWLAELLRPLPESVVEHVVWDMAMHDAHSGIMVSRDNVPALSVPNGLSLGASTSPIVGERIIGEILTVAQAGAVITYADNLFVNGPTEQAVDGRIHRIGESIAQLDFGALRLRVNGHTHTDLEGRGPHDMSRPIFFLKQEGRLIGDKIAWSPGISKLNQYMASAAEHLSMAQISAVERRIRHWRRSYADWVEGDKYEAEYLATLAVRRYYLDQSRPNLSAAIHAVVIAWIGWGQFRGLDEFVPTEGDIRCELREPLLAEIRGWLDRSFDRQEASAA